MAKKLIAANWKENPGSAKDAVRLFKAVAAVQNPRADVLICAPFLFLEPLADTYRRLRPAGRKSRLALGAEDVFWEEKGAFTGGIGPKMLASFGVRHMLIGHSERRKWFRETDAMVNRKAKQVLQDGFTAILCVGEPRTVRKKGSRAAEAFVRAQLEKDLKGVPKGKLIVAYEPIWAIGSGEGARPEDAATMARCIKRALARKFGKVKVLYGGSVDGKTARNYVTLKDIDGALVGGASLKADEFKKIINSI